MLISGIKPLPLPQHTKTAPIISPRGVGVNVVDLINVFPPLLKGGRGDLFYNYSKISLLKRGTLLL